eukprot:6545533-Prymnesium_polylepis.1
MFEDRSTLSCTATGTAHLLRDPGCLRFCSTVSILHATTPPGRDSGVPGRQRKKRNVMAYSTSEYAQDALGKAKSLSERSAVHSGLRVGRSWHTAGTWRYASRSVCVLAARQRFGALLEPSSRGQVPMLTGASPVATRLLPAP